MPKWNEVNLQLLYVPIAILYVIVSLKSFKSHVTYLMSLAKSDIASESCFVLAKIATSFNDIFVHVSNLDCQKGIE